MHTLHELLAYDQTSQEGCQDQGYRVQSERAEAECDERREVYYGPAEVGVEG